MAQAKRKTTKTTPAKQAKTKRPRLPKAVLEAAAIEFEPASIGTKGLEGLPTNEEFGEYMPWVRLSAIFLTQPKAELVKMVLGFAHSDDAIEAHVATMKGLERCESVLRDFAAMCANARGRLYIANCAAEKETV